MLHLLDFDGTVTTEDTIDLLVRAWVQHVWDETERGIASGEMTLNDALVRQLAGVRATEQEVLDFLRPRVELRAGLADLIGFCRERFVDPVIVSSGFHEVIEPILRWHDVDLPVVAHHVAFSPDGATVDFLDRLVCDHCGEECKRAETARLAAGRPVAYVGDGWSDRCAAAGADLVFARATLAGLLAADGVPFVPFEDFGDVRAGLAAYLAAR